MKTVYIVFHANVNLNTMNALRGVIVDAINKKYEHLYFVISSTGGSVVDGLNVAALIRALPVETTMHNVNQVDSVANVIFSAGKNRLASSNASFLFHGVQMNFQATSLTEQQLNEQYLIAKRLREDIAKNFADYCGIPLDDSRKLTESGTTILSAKEAKQKSIIAEIKDLQIPAGAEVVQIQNTVQ